MPRFAANLSMMFTEAPFIERFALAARAGFEEVEFLFPYAHPVAELKAVLAAHKLKVVLHNMPAGNWDAGDRGMAGSGSSGVRALGQTISPAYQSRSAHRRGWSQAPRTR